MTGTPRKEQVLLVDCPRCAIRINAEALASYEFTRSHMRGSGRYLFLRCRSCSEPLVVQQENVGNIAEGDIWADPTVLFPTPSFHVNPDAPAAVRTSLTQAHKTFVAGAYTATAIMCRRAVEAVCAAHGVSKGSLAAKLANLRNAGAISAHLFDWADMLRVAGNEAAHDVEEEVGRADAKDMLDFALAVTEYLYSYRDKFEAFKARREKGKRPTRGAEADGEPGDA